MNIITNKKHFWLIWALSIVTLAASAYIIIASKNNPKISIVSSPAVTETKKASETFAVYGDSRTGHDIHRQIVNQIASLNPKFVLHTGDMVNNGSIDEEWDRFNEIARSIKSQLFPVLGNHEQNSKLYYDNFNLPNNERWYSVEASFIDFIFLDSNIAIESSSEQMKWLESELSRVTQNNKFIIVVFHHAPFSSANHGMDKNVLKLQTDLVPILETNQVSLTLNGNDHVYERSYRNGIYYLTIGGGGAPLYSKKFDNSYSQKFFSVYNYAKITASENQLDITAYNASGTEIDALIIFKTK